MHTHFPPFRWENLFRSLEGGRQRIIMEIIIRKFSPIFIPGYEISSSPPWMLPRSYSSRRTPFSYTYRKEFPTLSIRVYNFSFSYIFCLFHPFISTEPFSPATLCPFHRENPTLLCSYSSPLVFTQASLLAKLKILMRSWKSEIWYSSPFTLPLFATATLREKGTLQTNRKIRMKLIETKMFVSVMT